MIHADGAEVILRRGDLHPTLFANEQRNCTPRLYGGHFDRLVDPQPLRVGRIPTTHLIVARPPPTNALLHPKPFVHLPDSHHGESNAAIPRHDLVRGLIMRRNECHCLAVHIGVLDGSKEVFETLMSIGVKLSETTELSVFKRLLCARIETNSPKIHQVIANATKVLDVAQECHPRLSIGSNLLRHFREVIVHLEELCVVARPTVRIQRMLHDVCRQTNPLWILLCDLLNASLRTVDLVLAIDEHRIGCGESNLLLAQRGNATLDTNDLWY